MYNPFSLKNKNILITGASGGIGRTCAITCTQMGANVTLIGRNKKRLLETYNLLEKGNHLFYVHDLADYSNFDSVVAEVVENQGEIDGFIHAAGIEITLPFKLHKPANYIEQFTINAVSGFEMSRILSKAKYCNKSGASFVFISSIAGTLGFPSQVGYSTSKGALISGVRSMAIELSKKNIRINAISPGMVDDTNMTRNLINSFSADWEVENKKEYPLGWLSTQDVANACLFLLSEASRKITGENIIVDGGFSKK